MGVFCYFSSLPKNMGYSYLLLLLPKASMHEGNDELIGTTAAHSRQYTRGMPKKKKNIEET